jgi:hypothetical protein
MSILRMRTKKGGSKQSVQERMMTEKRKGGQGEGEEGLMRVGGMVSMTSVHYLHV